MQQKLSQVLATVKEIDDALTKENRASHKFQLRQFAKPFWEKSAAYKITNEDLVKLYGQKDEATGNWKVLDEKSTDFFKEMQEVLNTVVDVAVMPLKLEWIDVETDFYYDNLYSILEQQDK